MATLRRRWRLFLGILIVVAAIVSTSVISNPGIQAAIAFSSFIVVIILIISGNRGGGGGINPWHSNNGNHGGGMGL